VIHPRGAPYTTPRAPEQSAQVLAWAVRSALRMADEHGLKSIALPAISTGIFGYPMEEAAEVMLRAAADYSRGRQGWNGWFSACMGSRPTKSSPTHWSG
jgi:Predicted phosphatase homologous to the C-terminal domain of histone macroH2A1